MPVHIFGIWSQLRPMPFQRLSSEDTSTTPHVDDNSAWSVEQQTCRRVVRVILSPLVFDVQTLLAEALDSSQYLVQASVVLTLRRRSHFRVINTGASDLVTGLFELVRTLSTEMSHTLAPETPRPFIEPLQIRLTKCIPCFLPSHLSADGLFPNYHRISFLRGPVRRKERWGVRTSRRER